MNSEETPVHIMIHGTSLSLLFLLHFIVLIILIDIYVQGPSNDVESAGAKLKLSHFVHTKNS